MTSSSPTRGTGAPPSRSASPATCPPTDDVSSRPPAPGDAPHAWPNRRAHAAAALSDDGPAACSSFGLLDALRRDPALRSTLLPPEGAMSHSAEAAGAARRTPGAGVLSADRRADVTGSDLGVYPGAVGVAGESDGTTATRAIEGAGAREAVAEVVPRTRRVGESAVGEAGVSCRGTDEASCHDSSLPSESRAASMTFIVSVGASSVGAGPQAWPSRCAQMDAASAAGVVARASAASSLCDAEPAGRSRRSGRVAVGPCSSSVKRSRAPAAVDAAGPGASSEVPRRTGAHDEVDVAASAWTGALGCVVARSRPAETAMGPTSARAPVIGIARR